MRDSGQLSRAIVVQPQKITDSEGSTSVQLSVLTYNVAGLPWPVSWGRREALINIGRDIGHLINQGRGPDIVLVQEGFVPEISSIGDYGGFVERASGPGVRLPGMSQDEPPGLIHSISSREPPRRWWKGEGIGSLIGSGLHIFSAYPIVGVKRMSFGNSACAGYDCLANKGALLIRILIPGMPEPLEIMTTHLNSTNAAGVSRPETDAAHLRQVKRLGRFWRERPDPDLPIILGGDFNTRGSQGRFVHLAKRFPGLTFVKDTCQEFGGPCHCEIDFKTVSPWLHSQDLQAFQSGTRITVRPIEARNVFNGSDGGEMLSDHTGYLVTYELDWTPSPDTLLVEH